MSSYATSFRSERGQAAVELALIAPALILLVLAATTLLEVAQKKALVTRLASQAARMAVYADDAGAIESYLKRSLMEADGGADKGRLKVRLGAASAGWMAKVGAPVKVSVDYSVPVPLLSGLPGSDIPVSASVVVEKWSNAVWFDI